jgi:ATP-dependent Clp protease ATP-binding subunit ClpC
MLEKALVMAADEAAWLGHHYVGTEHLLLGITRIAATDSESLLSMLDTSADTVRRRVRIALDEGTLEMSLVIAKRKARLSELSRRVLNAAEQMAAALDHPSVGLGHLLLVLYLEQRSPTSKVLRENRLNTNTLRAGLRQRDPDLMLTVETLLGPAVECAQSLGSHYTGTEHLLLALTRDIEGVELLKRCGVKPEVIHRQMEALLR